MNFKDFLKKIKFKYNVVVINENTLTEKFNIHLSWLSLTAIAGLLILVSFSLLSLLIFATPIRHYLPGYGNAASNHEMIEQAMRIDSLAHSLEMNGQQLENIKRVIADDISVDSIPRADSIVIEKNKSLSIETTEREKKFVEEHKEKK
ncbi:MAG: hypothetical protein MJZ93_05785 [Paludibacteraceae bacterium]|nr:hypothetical protein [Paludibacteraceae bacterium]